MKIKKPYKSTTYGRRNRNGSHLVNRPRVILVSGRANRAATIEELKMQRPIPYTIDDAVKTLTRRGFCTLGIFVCYEDICRDVVLAYDTNATDEENAFSVFLLDDMGNVIQGWFNLTLARANYRFNLQSRTV